MYHSINFGDKNTWDDWHLIPKSRPVVNPPAVKTNYIEIPGGDGVLDLTTALTGRPMYKNRTGSFEFYVENGFKDWAVLYSEIMAHLQGWKQRMILEDDPGYFYEGRFNVNEWRSEKDSSIIVIDYNVAPYKWDMTTTLEDWLWDTFNFESGVIRFYRDIQVTGSKTVRITGFPKSTKLDIITTSNMSVTYDEATYQLPIGRSTMHNIVITEGDHDLVFTGTGRVSIEYRGGML